MEIEVDVEGDKCVCLWFLTAHDFQYIEYSHTLQFDTTHFPLALKVQVAYIAFKLVFSIFYYILSLIMFSLCTHRNSCLISYLDHFQMPLTL